MYSMSNMYNMSNMNKLNIYSNERLEGLVDNNRTDKNTVHSYLPLYQKLLRKKKETAKNVLIDAR